MDEFERVMEEARSFLEEYPDAEGDIEHLLEVDSSMDGWTFHDIAIDSGLFGEVVSRDLAQKANGEYRLTNRDAIERALQSDPEPSDSNRNPTSSPELDTPDLSPVTDRINPSLTSVDFPSLKRVNFLHPRVPFILTLLGTLILVVVMRSLHYRAIFREHFVLSTANDPYHYRHWVDQLLIESPGLLSLTEIGVVLEGNVTGKPLLYTFGWWATVLLEGNPDQSGTVLAVLPVLGAVLTGLVIGWTALVVSKDERIAVLSVFVYAVLPANFLYTHLGFFEHSFIAFLCLAVMAGTLVWLERDLADRDAGGEQAVFEHVADPKTWGVSGVFGFAVGVAMLVWNGAPLLLITVATYAAIRPAYGIRVSHPPLLTCLPLLGGLAIGLLLGSAAHFGAGWQEFAAVAAPGVVFFGALFVSGISELVYRWDGLPRQAFGASIAMGFTAFVTSFFLFPDVMSRYRGRFSHAFLGREGIAEARGLFIPEISIHFGPYEQFGLFLIFILPGLLVVSWKVIKRHSPLWLVIVSFGWPLFTIMLYQRRFAGEFSVVAGIFAAVGFLWILGAVGLTKPTQCFSDRNPVALVSPEWDSGRVLSVVGVFIVLVILVAVMAPVYSEMTSTIPPSDSQYETAVWLEEQTHGEQSYVLSSWPSNRMYNYLVWGGGDDYGYAMNNYDSFLWDDDPDAWYEEFASDENGETVEYIVIDRQPIEGVQDQTTYGQLVQLLGSATPEPGIDGLAHYQIAFISSNDQVAVARPVPGATIEGHVDDLEEDVGGILAATNIEIQDMQFSHVRRAEAMDNGTLSVTVAYPGTYEINNERTVTVSEAQVEAGDTIQLSDS